MSNINRTYGWKPDSLDHRDCMLAYMKLPSSLPSKADLRGTHMPPVYDQGQLGSCTANAIAAAVDYERSKQGEAFVTPARLFIYYNERNFEGTVNEDSGAQIRDGMKMVGQFGVCPESLLPYNIAKFKVKPTPAQYSAALKYQTLTYARVIQDRTHIQTCIASLLQPVVFGFSVFSSFESATVAKTGVVPMPGKKDQPLGGHAVLAVGYDDAQQAYLVRNSWGNSWGQAGYFWMPYAYLESAKLADDLWTISLEE